MRWKAFIPTVILLALIAVFTLFYLDNFVKRAIEHVGTAANGAKVELDNVDISLKNFSIMLHRLQVTDKEHPMTNAFEVESLKFDLAGKPLSWKKIIIEKSEITGIRTGTPRKTSGALPKKLQKPGEPEAEAPSKVREMGKKAGSFAVANLKEQYDPKKLIQPEHLASYKKVQEDKARLTQLSQDWEKRVDSIQIRDKTSEIKAWLDRVKKNKYSGVEGLQAAQQTIQEANRYRKDLKGMRKTVSDMNNTLKTEIASAKGSLKQIDVLKSHDLSAAVGQLKSGAFSAEGISRGVIGPVWFGKLQDGLQWFHKIRGMIPQSKEGAKPPRPPRTGQDISFPFR